MHNDTLLHKISSVSDVRAPGIDLAESAAVTASLLCLAHCILIPLAVAALPLLSSALALPESFHIGVLLFAAPTALFALGAGWRQHSRTAPLTLGMSGILLLGLALVFPVHETVLTIIGSLTLVTAHLANWRLRHARHG